MYDLPPIEEELELLEDDDGFTQLELELDRDDVFLDRFELPFLPLNPHDELEFEYGSL